MRFLVTISLFLFAFVIMLPAQTLTVTTAEDTVDATDGVLSLREAVTEANNTAGVQSIRFDASVFDPDTISLDSSLHLTDPDGADISGMGAMVYISSASQDTIFALTLHSGNNVVSYLNFAEVYGSAVRVKSPGMSNNEIGPGNKIQGTKGIGILVENSMGNRIHGNWIWETEYEYINNFDNNGDGIALVDTSDMNVVENNWAWSNNGIGIVTYSSSQNVFKGNYLIMNYYLGMGIWEGKGANEITENRAFKNLSGDIALLGGDNNNNMVIQNAIGDSTLMPDTLLTLYQESLAKQPADFGLVKNDLYQQRIEQDRSRRAQRRAERLERAANNPKEVTLSGQTGDAPQEYVSTDGLQIMGSSNNLVSGNIFSNGEFGVATDIYYDNYRGKNGDEQVTYYSENNRIIFNVFKYVYAGIAMNSMYNVLIQDNLFTQIVFAVYAENYDNGPFKTGNRISAEQDSADLIIVNNVIESSYGYYLDAKKHDAPSGGYYGEGAITINDYEDVYIADNRFNQVYNGISLEQVGKARISDNLFEQVAYYGLNGYQFDSLYVNNNTFNTGGVYFYNYSDSAHGHFYAAHNEFENPWYYGLYLEYVRDVDLHYNTIRNSEENGIYLYYCTNSMLMGNYIDRTRYDGIYTYYSDSLYLHNNQIKNTAYEGMELYYGDYVEAYDNEIFNSTYTGMYIYQFRHADVQRNTVSLSGNHGLYMDRCSTSMVKNNNFMENPGYGMYLYRDTVITVTENFISNNGSGVYSYQLENHTINNNSLMKNVEYGWYHSGSDTVDVRNNYWGSPNGPALTDTVFPGYISGDRSYGNILTDPFLTAPGFMPEVQPVIDRLEPAEAPREGGQPFAVLGRQMLPGAMVYIDGNPVEEVFLVGSNRLAGVVPPGFGGYVDVVVVNPGGYADTLADGFMYENYAPLPFDLLMPAADGVVSEAQPVFTWEEAADVDGDDVQYVFMWSRYESFKDSLYEEGISDTSFVLSLDLEPNTDYYWRVLARDGRRGGNTLSDTRMFSTDELSSVEGVDNLLPKEFALHQNYPNPFNPVTNIAYDLKAAANVELTMYNMLGQKVAVLVNQRQNAGRQIMQFDASNLASGIYIYKIAITGAEESFVSHKKMILIK